MKKLTDWIKDNKLISLLILAAIAWVLYMGFKDGGWWNKSTDVSGKRIVSPCGRGQLGQECDTGVGCGTYQNGPRGCRCVGNGSRNSQGKCMNNTATYE